MLCRYSVACLILAVATITFAQNKAGSLPTDVVTRDAPAIEVVTKCLESSGGVNAIEAIRDFSASGAVSYFWAGKEVRGQISIMALGLDDFRLNVQLPDDARTFSLKGSTGFIRRDGETVQMPLHKMLGVNPLVYFLPGMLAGLREQDAVVSYVGLEMLNGTQVHHVKIQRRPIPELSVRAELSQMTSKDFYIDTNSFLVIKIDDQAFRDDTENDPLPHSLVFSKYVTSDGILLPLVIDESTHNVPISHIELDSARFNLGLAPSAFD